MGLTRAHTAMASVALATAVLLAHAQSFSVPFVFDDLDAITSNPRIRQLWPPRYLAGAEAAPLAGRPLAALTIALNYRFGGLNVAGYHAVNVAIHIAASVMAFVLVAAVFARLCLPWPVPAAFACALLWALHPVQTDAVVYTIQRTELLASALMLAAMLCVERSLDSRRPRAFTWGAGTAAVLAALCKEISVALLPLVLAYDHVFAPRGTPARPARRLLYAAVAGSWAVLAVLMARGDQIQVAIDPEGRLSPWAYLGMQARILPYYALLWLWPAELNLAYDWPPPLSLGGVLPWIVLDAAIVLLGAYAIVRRRPFGFAIAWWFLILAPTSSILPIPTEIVAERRLYLPFLALAASTVAGTVILLHKTALSSRHRVVAGVTLMAVAAAACGLRTAARIREYRDPLTLWSITASRAPGHGMARNNLGRELLSRGRLDEAEREFRAAVERLPEYALVHNNLGFVLLEQGRPREAATALSRAVELKPDHQNSRFNLGRTWLALGRHDEARAQLEQALRLRPDDDVARLVLATALTDGGQVDAAIEHVRATLARAPRKGPPRTRIAGLLAATGRDDLARRELEIAAQEDPAFPLAHYALGTQLEKGGDIAGALARFRLSARLAHQEGDVETARLAQARLARYE